MPSFAYPEAAAGALGRAAAHATWLRRSAGRVPDLVGVDAARAEEVVRRALETEQSVWLEPDATRSLLAAYGLPVVEERYAATPDEAVAAASEIGYPVVVKLAAAGAHKTELGGVALGLVDPDAVRAAATRMGAPVLVQRHVRDGVELLAGVAHDPVFGPLVAFGPGGRGPS